MRTCDPRLPGPLDRLLFEVMWRYAPLINVVLCLVSIPFLIAHRVNEAIEQFKANPIHITEVSA